MLWIDTFNESIYHNQSVLDFLSHLLIKEWCVNKQTNKNKKHPATVSNIALPSSAK